MATVSLIYDLDTGTWTTPAGVAGTDWLPPLTYGEQPTLSISATGSVPDGFSDATSWQCAVARDWLCASQPMARTTDGVAVSETDDGIEVTAPLDTQIDRFLRVVDGKGDGVKCWLQVVGLDSDATPCCFLTFPILCLPALDPEGSGTVEPIVVSAITEAAIDAKIASAIASAQGLAAMDYTTLSGASGTVEPGHVYTLTMTEDFTLSAATVTGYGESVIFVTPGTNTFSVADGITLDAEMSNFSTYRLMVSWTPIGVIVEQTGEWLADD